MNQVKTTFSLSIFIMLSLYLASLPISSGVAVSSSLDSTASFDYWPTNGWQHSTPEEHGMVSEQLEEMMEYIDENNYRYDSIVIIRDGYLVFERHLGSRYEYNGRHPLYSVTKSITSVLIGIAINQGYIENVDQPILDFFPNRTVANLDDDKRSITVKNLLLMNSGVEWDEWSTEYGSSDNSVELMLRSGDTVQYFLDLPMAHSPGEVWVYNSGGTHMLGAIIRQTTGMSVLQFANQYLFSPLNITDVWWDVDLQGHYYCGGGLHLTPHDLAKIGFLFLNNGTWDGQEIVTQSWVEESTQTIVYPYENLEYMGYGYQWWTLPTLDIFDAAGIEGQNLYVDMNQDLIVVFTASHPRYESHPNDQLLYQYILGSVGGMDSDVVNSQVYLSLALLVGTTLPIIFAAVLWFTKIRRF
jgi:CubicO group peptidase (beta-lactamase class C family)